MDSMKSAMADSVATEPNLSTERLAAEAFDASERVRTLEMMNMPTDYEDRKKAFVALALAREAASRARARLDRRMCF